MTLAGNAKNLVIHNEGIKIPPHLAYVRGKSFGRIRTCESIKRRFLKPLRLATPQQSNSLLRDNILSTLPITFTRDPCSATELRPRIMSKKFAGARGIEPLH